MFLYPILDLPKKSIVGFLSRSGKKILIIFTEDAAQTLLQYSKYFRENSISVKSLVQEKGTLEYIVIETLAKDATKTELRERAAVWMKYYRSIGYDTCGKRLPVEYKLIMRINSKYKMEVLLKTKGKLSKVVGVFEQEKDAKAFVRKHYKDLDNIEKLVYHESFMNRENE